MGTTQSLLKIQNFLQLHTLQQKDQTLFLGFYEVFKSKYNHHHHFYMTKTITFNHLNELQNYKSVLNSIQTKPFNILYPINLYKKNKSSFMNTCSNNDSIIILHKYYKDNLQTYLELSHSLPQEKIWFIINQISKSLESLQQLEHYHLYLMPENIYYDKNENWFIYDGFFIHGDDKTDFLQQKIRKKAFMSQQHKNKIKNGSYVNSHQSLLQDAYCLGFCIIFMITNLHPKDFSTNQQQRQMQVDTFFNKQNNYSKQLISFIKGLIKPQSKKRYSIKHIRKILKSKQQDIIMKQSEQWLKQKDHYSSQITYNPFKKSRNNGSDKRGNFHKNRQNQQSNANQNHQNSQKTLKKSYQQTKILIKPKIHPFPTDNNGMQRSYQGTPIRRIDESIVNSSKQESRLFNNSQQFIKSYQFNSPQHCNVPTNFNSPPHYRLPQQHFVSPMRYSSPIHTTNQQPNYVSPPHYNNNLPSNIPLNVNLNYFSPRKNYQ